VKRELKANHKTGWQSVAGHALSVRRTPIKDAHARVPSSFRNAGF